VSAALRHFRLCHRIRRPSPLSRSERDLPRDRPDPQARRRLLQLRKQRDGLSKALRPPSEDSSRLARGGGSARLDLGAGVARLARAPRPPTGLPPEAVRPPPPGQPPPPSPRPVSASCGRP